MKKLTLILHFLSSLSLFAETQFLLKPTSQEVASLSNLYEQSGTVVPLAIVYDTREQKLLSWGIPLSKRIRNGVHARLVVESELAKNLEEVQQRIQTKQSQFFGGTLFIEIQDGEPVLGYHGWNSNRSTMNIDEMKEIPKKVLRQISNILQMPIKNASIKLKKELEDGNITKYGKEEGEWRNAYAIDPFFKEVQPDLALRPSESPTKRDVILEQIKQLWLNQNKCVDGFVQIP